MTDKPVLRATARFWLGGRRTTAELLLGPADDGVAMVGVLGLGACPEVCLLRLLLRGNSLELSDVVDPEADRQLAQAFGLPADEIRDICCELATQMLADMLEQPAEQPGGWALH